MSDETLIPDDFTVDEETWNAIVRASEIERAERKEAVERHRALARYEQRKP